VQSPIARAGSGVGVAAGFAGIGVGVGAGVGAPVGEAVSVGVGVTDAAPVDPAVAAATEDDGIIEGVADGVAAAVEQPAIAAATTRARVTGRPRPLRLRSNISSPGGHFRPVIRTRRGRRPGILAAARAPPSPGGAKACRARRAIHTPGRRNIPHLSSARRSQHRPWPLDSRSTRVVAVAIMRTMTDQHLRRLQGEPCSCRRRVPAMVELAFGN